MSNLADLWSTLTAQAMAFDLPRLRATIHDTNLGNSVDRPTETVFTKDMNSTAAATTATETLTIDGDTITVTATQVTADPWNPKAVGKWYGGAVNVTTGLPLHVRSASAARYLTAEAAIKAAAKAVAKHGAR